MSTVHNKPGWAQRWEGLCKGFAEGNVTHVRQWDADIIIVVPPSPPMTISIFHHAFTLLEELQPKWTPSAKLQGAIRALFPVGVLSRLSRDLSALRVSQGSLSTMVFCDAPANIVNKTLPRNIAIWHRYFSLPSIPCN